MILENGLSRNYIFELPPLVGFKEKFEGNIIQHYIEKNKLLEVRIEEFKDNKGTGYILNPIDGRYNPILASINLQHIPPEYKRVIKINNIDLHRNHFVNLNQSEAIWIKHPISENKPNNLRQSNKLQLNILNSWIDSFKYIKEKQSEGTKGLRKPQIGALHAIKAHWSITNNPATVVMPTGTGKTEVMLSALISERIERLLVIVPTDALRTQIYTKFLSLGILKDLGIVSNSALFPIVGLLIHRPKSVELVDDFFSRCNVIVTTINIGGQCDEKIQERMSDLCPYLFIDEAHHIAAPTWTRFKEKFSSSYILQFTATPFRNDGKSVEGKPIYNYPLAKAQEEGYFKKIQYKPVIEFNPTKSDIAIADKAIVQLRADYDKGHILMARVGSISRAEEVFKIYEKYTEFNPVQIHTGLKLSRRKEIRSQIINKETRIIVCVDMFGEGFDLPELKIAAFHDIRKSLPITLQLAGRFTRTKEDLGDPTFIANIAQADVKDELRQLYSQDTDWNLLLSQTSDEATKEEVDLWEFIEGFNKFPEEISLQNVRPAMSTVVYRTYCSEWQPENFHQGLSGYDNLDNYYSDINSSRNTIVVVTAQKIPVDWARINEIYTWSWELYVAYWYDEHNLLFIHGSSKSGFYKDIAIALAGDNVVQFKGSEVFRCLHGINRLRLQNVGLIKRLGRLIRYTMQAGSDVEPGLSEAAKRNTTKSNIFGAGFENGHRTSIGCSYKGRIWSRRTTNLNFLIEWFRQVGHKLLDETIDPDYILRGTLVPEMIFERPKIMPIAIDWPDIMYQDSHEKFNIHQPADFDIQCYETDIKLIDPSETGDIKFEIVSDKKNIEFDLLIVDDIENPDFTITETSGYSTNIEYGLKSISIENFFYEHPPIIWFSDGSSLEGNSFVKIRRDYEPFPRDAIKVWDWTGVNIKNESQGITRDDTSIQYKVIQELKNESFDVIYDDDDPGESADIVAIKISDESIIVNLYHCKFSIKVTPGARIKDLYELCGQAQKSVRWMDHPTDLIKHLLMREPRKRDNASHTRFELGDKKILFTIHEMCRVIPIEMNIFVVQPGLSKNKASINQLELLSVTQNYLIETFLIPFYVIGSD